LLAGLKATTKKDKYEKISEKKINTTIESLCKHYPGSCASSLQIDLILTWLPFAAEFATYLNYCRSLRFDDKPDYS
jgi:hypothetical protein